MSAASVRPTSLPISKLLANRSPARVPRYQRSYAWTDEQVGDLIDDIKRLLPTQTGTRGHFYGGMVAIEIGDSASAEGTIYEIVDGQQRLATFCLLLAQISARATELRSVAKSQDAPEVERRLEILAKGIHHEFLYYQRYDVREGTESRQPRVRLSHADDEFFQSLLNGDQPNPCRDSHKLLKNAVELLRNELVRPITPESDLQGSLEVLQRLRDAVLRDSFVIHIVSDERSSGYRLFTVLNDRGARLTVADLLRSHTLEMLDAEPELCKKAARLWDDMLTDGGDNVDEFLRVYFTSLTGGRPRRDDLFDEMKKLMFAANIDSGLVVDRLTGMSDELKAFLAISSGVWPYLVDQQDQAVTEWQRSRLFRLVTTLRHELSTPLLLAARARCDEKSFAELVHIIEIFAFRYKNVCGAHAGPASSSYYAECKRLRGTKLNGHVSFSRLRESLRGLLMKRAPDSIFKNSLADYLRYDAGSAAKANIRHLLTIIEDYRPWIKLGASGMPVPAMITVTDLSQASIEHIYPQNAQPQVPALQPYINRIGNLSYWSPLDNGAAGNLSFVDKLPAYRASKVGLNNDLGVLSVWDLAALQARETQLINEACLIFVV
ncbi:DUF262 domain-containing HNH endonuclease family protein [Nocardia sp. NEAU-G5]|uniref:DUF262 domain-containing HNH endonuclease family protein n=1 Tax=Nocardia albiluteola TaxID=2842303 RepID=A0ABS6AZS9_9NOCA|nr:DUF262 domain-containing protein [Nocardia albiluteola]MBU3063558.1 DUF262 domain-containing HNH endonuclease family protein [Nocardia albiluteola]